MPRAPGRSAARKIAAVDIYNNDTMKQADIKIILRPGTDGAFACGVMHVLFRDACRSRLYGANTPIARTSSRRI